MATPTTAQLQSYAVMAAQREGVPVNMFLWQIGKESAWDPNAKNPNSSAKGIAQFIDGTAKQFNLNPLDPYASLDAAAKYDAQLYKQTGSWQKALESYGTLHNASSLDQAAFQGALVADNVPQGEGSGLGSMFKKLWDNSAGGLAVDTYKNLTGQGGDGSGNWDFSKILGSGTFIILGVVVIALAILSNKTAQTVVTTAVKKGA